MAVEIPGMSLSIIRQETRIQPGRPLLTSGRFTAFGLGVPAFIRVSLEGPSYDPQIRSFDTFASPFSGDYSVNVIAEKGGSYQVYAQAFPPPILPTGPPFPDAILLLPPMAESTRPPLVVGGFTDGGVDFGLPDGTSQFLQTPPQSPIEFRPVITLAPGISIAAPGVPSALVPGLPPYYPEPLPPFPPAPPVERITAALLDIQMSPPLINPGQEATGVMSWRNTGTATQSFDLVLYLIDQRGARYGPLQLVTDVVAAPQIPQVTNLRLGTQGLPSGDYSVQGEIYDSATGQLIDTRTVPYRLSIREIAPPVIPVPEVPEIPEIPELPEIPEVPAVPTADILEQPTLNLLRDIRVGDIWSGSVSLPTLGLAPYYLAAQVILIDPTGREIPAGDIGRVIQPGETLNIPVNLNTANFTPGTYNILLRVVDQYGAQLWQFPMGFLSLLEAIAPPPELPEAPPFPTADMIQIPIVNLPNQVTLGEVWQGNISVPTVWPVTLPQVPSIPSYNFSTLVQLENPAGQRFDVVRNSVFTPGQPINIPINFDTGVLPEAGMHNVLMTLTDFQGRDLFDAPIGLLDVLPFPEIPELPEVPGIPEVPEVPIKGKFTDITINLGPSQVQVGETIDIPLKYTHIGPGEVAIIRASLGDMRAGIFDEVWGAERSVDVPTDITPETRDITISVPITEKFAAAGIYTVEAKVNHWVPRVITRRENLVEVVEAPAPPAPPPTVPAADIKNVDFSVPKGTYEIGDNVPFTLSYEYKGRQQRGQLSISIGTGVYPTFNPVVNLSPMSVDFGQSMDWASHSFSGTFALTGALEAGRMYNTRAKLETLEDRTQEIDTDWSVIDIAAPPELPPSTFPDCTVIFAFKRVTYGDTVNIPVTFSHYGGREMIAIRASIGQFIAGLYDEVLYGEVDWVVPDEARSRTRTVTVSIPITKAIRPGTYHVKGEVKRVQTGRGVVASPVVQNVVEVYEVPVAPPPTYKFTIGRITASPDRINVGDMVRVSAPVTNRSNVRADVTVYFRFYEGSALPAHGRFLERSGGMRKTMEPGETFTFGAARIERSDASRFDVACDVTVQGSVVESREDDDVYRKA